MFLGQFYKKSSKDNNGTKAYVYETTFRNNTAMIAAKKDNDLQILFGKNDVMWYDIGWINKRSIQFDINHQRF